MRTNLYGWYWWERWSRFLGKPTPHTIVPYAPKATSDISSFALTLTKKSDGTYGYEEAASGKSGKFTISDNVITFDQSIPFVVAEGSQRTVTINTNQIYVVKADNDNNQFPLRCT